MTLKLKPQEDGKEAEAAEEVETGKEGEAKPEAVVDTEKETLKAEKERLERENEELRTRSTAQPRITAAQLKAMSEAEREQVEKTTGLPFDQVVSRVEAQEIGESQKREISRNARENVRDAIEDATERDPQIGKLKSGIKEYLEDISDEVKSDPKRLKAVMAKAITYARGKVGPTREPAREPSGRVRIPKPNDEAPYFEDTDEDNPKAGKIKPGTYRLNDDFKVEIQDLIPKEKRDKFKHPEHPTGVRVAQDFDEAPKFRR